MTIVFQKSLLKSRQTDDIFWIYLCKIENILDVFSIEINKYLILKMIKTFYLNYILQGQLSPPISTI